MRKYELTEETKTLADGTVLYRIRAVKDFALADGTEVLAGDLGGWIEKEYNLSHGGYAWVYGDARVYGDAEVFGDALVYGDAEVYGDALVYGDARVFGYARVYGDARVSGYAEVYGDAEVKSIRDYAVFKNGWSSGRWFTYTRSDRKWKVGCFHGTGEELIAKAYEDSELSGKCYETIVRAQEAIDKAIEAEKGETK